MNQTRKYTGSSFGKVLTERVAIWSVPVGVLIIAGAFYAGNVMAGNRKPVPPPTVIKPPTVFGVAEPVYTSLPNIMHVREPETDLLISTNPQPQPRVVSRSVARDNRIVQQSESIDSTGQQDGITVGATQDSAAINDADVYKMDSSRPAEPSSVAAKRSESYRIIRKDSGTPRHYPPVPEKMKPDISLKAPEVAKDDPWNGETRRRYDSFFNDADFRDGHRSGDR